MNLNDCIAGVLIEKPAFKHHQILAGPEGVAAGLASVNQTI